MNKFKVMIVLSLTLYLGACGVSKEVSKLNDDEMAKVLAKNPDLNKSQIAELANGKAVYTENCQTCHELKDPMALNAQGWEGIVPPMVEKVNEKGDKINAKAQQQLLAYLTSVCKD